MKKDLTLYETRVIGVLLEKQIATPEQYPMSLNGLTNACNQKSNRYPVLELTESVVSETLQILTSKGFIRADNYKSRVEKYAHRFCNTEFGDLQFSPRELAVVAELLLRGAQTPGELRSRANRLAAFDSVDQVDEVLKSLADDSKGPWVTMLPREPGKRESRYVHLFSSDIEPVVTETVDIAKLSGVRAEIAELKAINDQLQQENDVLKARLRALGEVC